MKKGDVILMLAVCAVAGVMAVFFIFNKSENKTVKVTKNNTVVFEGELIKDNIIELETNTIVIEKGRVNVKNATCKNQICVKHKPISEKGEVIACLPNKVIIEIK